MVDPDQKHDADSPDLPLDPELIEDLGAEFGLRGDQLEAALEEARTEAARNLETAQRVQAETDNYRKRMAREHADAIARAGERLSVELLPAIDNLERALAHATDIGTDSELLNGLEMVLGQLLDVLAKEGVKQVDPLNGRFDALKHQAVGQAEDPGVPEGTVTEVYQKGYEMRGRMLRSAMVIVSTGGPPLEE